VGDVGNAWIKVRRLLPADAALYREIRLQGLRCDPEAFGSTFAVENAQPLTWFAKRLESSAVFGAFDGSALLGIVGFFICQRPKEAHKGVLVGMYVRPQARRAGVGQLLVEAVIDHARRHVEIIQLTVVSGNEQAKRLYANFGFIEYGIEKNSLKHYGCYWDEVLMAKPLSAPEAPRS
jgi:RimJ/RimL family protein N-acetyltransferase